MSFREKTAWVTLCAIVLVSLLYWFHVHTPFEPHSHLHVLHAMALSIVAYALIEFVAWLVLSRRNPQEARTPKDERERLIDLKAMRIAYYVLAVGTLASIFITLHLISAGPVGLGMAVFASFVLSQIVRHAARIVYYRRDA